MSMSTRSKTARLARRQSPAAAAPPEPESAPSAIPPEEAPPADKCAICLSNIANKCKTNSCRHEFCFSCLLEWSKVKAECPLCKSVISTITHNIRIVDGRESHDTYTVPVINDDFANLLAGPPSQLGIRINLGQIGLGQHGSSLFSEFGRLDTSGSFNNYLQSIIHFGNPTVINTRGGPPPAHASSSRSSPSRFVNLGEFPEGLSINVLPAPPLEGENPFVGPDDDLAGAELFPDQFFHGPYGTQSYQRRRRVYDRGQYVTPFSSSMQPGAVFFPSVEYFRTHPLAFSRLKPWLRRELTVLLGLTNPRSRLAALYELIMSLLMRYDVRGREFREMIRIYFESSARVKHFQHELYHFALSGLGMTTYDRIATYPDNRGDGHSANPSVPVVTIDDDEVPGPSPRGEELITGRRQEKRHRRQRADADTPPMNLSATAPPDREERSHHRDPNPEPQPGTSRAMRGDERWRLIDGHGRSGNREPSPPSRTDDWRQKKKLKLNDEGPKREPATDESDSDDCELLGVHPIVKPPPLAVITIASSDSESDDEVSEMEAAAAAQFGYYVPEKSKKNKTKKDEGTVEPNLPSGTEASENANVEVAPVEVDDSTSSSSVYVVDEIRHSSAPGFGRPSSPKPSTSAAARARLNGCGHLPMRKNNYLLQRMFADIDTVEQEISEPEPEVDEEVDDPLSGLTVDWTEEDLRIMRYSRLGHKRRRESSCSSSTASHNCQADHDTNGSAWKHFGDSLHKFETLIEGGDVEENSEDWDYTAFAPDSNSQRDEAEQQPLLTPANLEARIAALEQQLSITEHDHQREKKFDPPRFSGSDVDD